MKHPKYGPYFLNIEAQKGRASYPLLNRIYVYVSNGISMQNYGRMEMTYKKLKPFISIWFIMNGPKKFQNSICVYSPKPQMIYGNQWIKDSNPKMKVIFIYLGKEIDSNNPCLALFGTLFQ